MEQDERRPERRPSRRPPERNSRAAQAAEQRRRDRRERERLDTLREKQRRKAKHRTRRRISPTALKRLLIMAAVVAAFVLSMVIFFRVRDIQVTGSTYYTAEEVIAACGITKGDNLLTISRGKAAGSVMAALPYVKTVQVTRHLPDTLELTVTECKLLSYLATHRGRVVSKTQILTAVWGYEEYSANLVEVNVSTLRRKLEAHGPRLLHTVRGQGYVLRGDQVPTR